MTKKELVDLLDGISDEAEVLLFPDEMEGFDPETQEDVNEGPGIGVFEKGDLIFLGNVQTVELMPLPGEEA